MTMSCLPNQRSETGEPEARARCAGQLGLATRIIMSNVWQDPDVPARSANHQTDSSIMAKLLKIAKTKDVPPGQAAALTIEGQKIAPFNLDETYECPAWQSLQRAFSLTKGPRV